MKKSIHAIVLAMACTSVFGQGKLITIPTGMYTGNAYLKLPDESRTTYLSGVLDGFLSAQIFGAPESKIGWLSSCTTGMYEGQILAIVDKWMSENPRNWNASMKINAYTAMHKACHLNR